MLNPYVLLFPLSLRYDQAVQSNPYANIPCIEGQHTDPRNTNSTCKYMLLSYMLYRPSAVPLWSLMNPNQEALSGGSRDR